VGEGIGKKLFVGSISDRSFKMTTDNGRPTTFYVESSGIAYWDNLIRSSSQYSLRNTHQLTQWAAAATAARAFLCFSISVQPADTGSSAYTPRWCLRALSPAVGYRCCTCRGRSRKTDISKVLMLKKLLVSNSIFILPFLCYFFS
jgi:hypothetical protein